MFESRDDSYDKSALSRAMQLSFYLTGTSYYKAFPTKKAIFKAGAPSKQQAAFLQKVYTEGLSQFIFENNLTVDQIVKFEGSDEINNVAQPYRGSGLLALQSGGKDSLLLATLLEQKEHAYNTMYVSSSISYPAVLNDIQASPRVIQRIIDRPAFIQAAQDGSLNGHVPVTYIIESYAVIDAILHNEATVLVSIGTEGEEPHGFVGDLPVNHQWSKTWGAEQLLTQYIHNYISPEIKLGSPLRGVSELKIAELFTQKCWTKFAHSFSSCNLANYKQGESNEQLKWCGECPKCANSYLLFAPFVEPQELDSLFGGQNLFKKSTLEQTFKGLLGIDGVMKPFECVGETQELRLAYHMAHQKTPAYSLPFEVPVSHFDYKKIDVAQDWAYDLIR